MSSPQEVTDEPDAEELDDRVEDILNGDFVTFEEHESKRE